MQPSLAMCRTQEARQLAIAANAPLENVKGVAVLAAIAWAKEGITAQRREERRAREDKQRLNAAPVLEDRIFSENPDRGFADPGPETED